MRKKTALDHIFDCLLIVAPTIMLLPLDGYSKTMLMFYVVYLPYLAYLLFKGQQKRELTKKNHHQYKKRKEIEVPILAA